MKTNKFGYREFCPEPIYPYTEKAEILRKVEIPYPKNMVMDTLIISRQPATRIITVSTTPVPILQPPHPTPYLVSNPSLAVGLTASTVFIDGTVNSAGNTQATPLGVANYMKMHFHFNITAITGTWDIGAYTRDPHSGNWAISQNLWSGLTTIGTGYDFIGEMGLVTDFAIGWNPTAAGSMTFSVTGTLKEGTAGAGTGLARTIFIGGRNVTPGSGYPLFEGKDKIIYPGANVEIYAVAYVDTLIKVFTL